MNVDKRQLARTQGKFTGVNERRHLSENVNDRTARTSREEEPRGTRVYRKRNDSDFHRNSHSSPSSGFRAYPNRNDQFPKRGKNLKYSPNEKYKFENLERKHEPKEIKDTGICILSETDTGQSRVYYCPNFLDVSYGYTLMTHLETSTEWHDKDVFINGMWCKQPRLVAWYGPLPYSYSGAELPPKEFPPEVMQVKIQVEQKLKMEGIDVEFNSVLLNLYRDNKDSVAWHSDDELSMGICPTIASVSIGERRRFEMRLKAQKRLPKDYADYVAHLRHGSLIVMDGVMQLEWEHRVPKEYHDKGPRINLTFRTVFPIDRVQRPVGKLEIQESAGDIPLKSRAPVNQEPFSYKEENFPSLGGSSNTNVDRVAGKGKDRPRKTSNPASRSERTNQNAHPRETRGQHYEEPDQNDHHGEEPNHESPVPLSDDGKDSPVSNHSPSLLNPLELNEQPLNEVTEDHVQQCVNGGVMDCPAVSSNRTGIAVADSSLDEYSLNATEHLKELSSQASKAMHDSNIADRDKEELEVFIVLSKAGDCLPVEALDALSTRMRHLLNPVIEDIKPQR